MLKVVGTRELEILPDDVISQEKLSKWAVKPVYLADSRAEYLTPVCVVQVFHRHGRKKPAWAPVTLLNKEAFREKKEEPEYVCNKCKTKVPLAVVEAKLDAMKKYRGLDPRNERRAAILAVRKERGYE